MWHSNRLSTYSAVNSVGLPSAAAEENGEVSANADSRQSRISVRLSESPVRYGSTAPIEQAGKGHYENRHEQARCGYQVMIGLIPLLLLEMLQ